VCARVCVCLFIGAVTVGLSSSVIMPACLVAPSVAGGGREAGCVSCSWNFSCCQDEWKASLTQPSSFIGAQVSTVPVRMTMPPRPASHPTPAHMGRHLLCSKVPGTWRTTRNKKGSSGHGQSERPCCMALEVNHELGGIHYTEFEFLFGPFPSQGAGRPCDGSSK
jgi:hypothetical protein